MSGKSSGWRTTGKSSGSGGVATSVSEQLIESIAASSPLLPEIKTYEITAPAGSNVSVTLTHNLGISEYIIQIVHKSSGDNIVLPFTRSDNDIVFYFGTVQADTDYTIIIVQ